MTNLLYKLWNKSLKTQLIYGVGFALVALTLAFTYSITSYQSDFLRTAGMKQVHYRSALLATSSKVWILANDYVGLEQVMDNFDVFDDLTFACVINLDGKIISHTDKSLTGKYVADEERVKYIKANSSRIRGVDQEKIISYNDKYIDVIRPIHEKDARIGFVNLRLSQSAREAAIKNTIAKGVAFTVIAILFGVSFAYLVANGLTKHLDRLIENIRKFRSGDRYVRASEDGVQELSELSREFNDLVKTLNATQALNQQLTERLELAFIATQDGLWDWDVKGDAVYFSPLWKAMIGYEDDELSNEFSTWKSRVHPDDLEKTLQDAQDNIDGKTETLKNVHRLLSKDGKWIWILNRGKVLYNDKGEAIRMVGTHTDVTKDKELQLRYAHQAQIIEQTVDSVISSDLQGNIINWNSGSRRLLGYTSEEMIGANVEVLYPKGEVNLFSDKVEELLKSGRFHQDVTLIRQDGSELSASLSLTLLKDESGEPTGIVCYSQDITARKAAESELKEQKNILEHQAYHDALTQLPNRLLFHDRLTRAIEKAKRNAKQLAVFFIDLDRFKKINDSLGHDIGDEVLRIVSKKLAGVMRKEDTLARIGGDEFTILMEDLSKFEDASILADKILKSLIEPMQVAGKTLYVSTSVGIALYPQDDENATNLLKFADAAMYKAKDEGRNNYQFYSPEMTMMASQHVTLETSLREALVNEEFTVFYQAQTDGENHKLTGMEALVRWNHPTKGLVAPSEFIPLAEETGLIVALDQWVMKTAIKQVVQWYKDGLNPGKLALNLAMKQLQHKDFIQMIKDALQNAGCKPEWIALEVTEGQIMTHPEKAIVLLREISNMGVELAVDDFGTGYSSLAYLKRLPINKLKIDQSFVRDLPYDEEDIGIAKSIIALSKSLNLEVIAEGVETSEQRDFLVKNGCKNVQGYFYGKPIPAHEMEAVLIKESL